MIFTYKCRQIAPPPLRIHKLLGCGAESVSIDSYEAGRSHPIPPPTNGRWLFSDLIPTSGDGAIEEHLEAALAAGICIWVLSREWYKPCRRQKMSNIRHICFHKFTEKISNSRHFVPNISNIGNKCLYLDIKSSGSRSVEY